jgi:hypothetical protein
MGQAEELKLEIITCDFFSSVYFGIKDEKLVEMQNAIKKSWGGILKRRT